MIIKINFYLKYKLSKIKLNIIKYNIIYILIKINNNNLII